MAFPFRLTINKFCCCIVELCTKQSGKLLQVRVYTKKLFFVILIWNNFSVRCAHFEGAPPRDPSGVSLWVIFKYCCKTSPKVFSYWAFAFPVEFVVLDHDRVPTRTGKMGRYFPVREKSGNFEQTGKVRENHTKYWKTEINIIWYF